VSEKLDPKDLMCMIKENTCEDMIIFDVRDEDRRGGHVPGSLNAPYSKFPEQTKELVEKYSTQVRKEVLSVRRGSFYA